MKVLLILVDGMRPDALRNIPYVEQLKKQASFTLKATTVCPSDTLPCHVSLFHSADPENHGILTNTYTGVKTPGVGLFELLRRNGKGSAMIYSWEQLRDLARPGSLSYSYYLNCSDHKGEDYIPACTEAAYQYIAKENPDFTFLYHALPDAVGHRSGWMSEAYLDAVRLCWDNIRWLLERLPEDYTVLITADHGGHDKTHGSDSPEDVTIPLFALGKNFVSGEELTDVTIRDIAPTIAKLLAVQAPDHWEGKSFL